MLVTVGLFRIFFLSSKLNICATQTWHFMHFSTKISVNMISHQEISMQINFVAKRVNSAGYVISYSRNKCGYIFFEEPPGVNLARTHGISQTLP